MLMIASCFLPWTYYKAIGDTFTGFHVTRFPTGNYYGKAGLTISVMTFMTLIFMLIPRNWARRFSMLPAALLVAFAIRTFVIFTGELIQGDVIKKPGIYLMVICSILVLLASVFSQGIDAASKTEDTQPSKESDKK